MLHGFAPHFLGTSNIGTMYLYNYLLIKEAFHNPGPISVENVANRIAIMILEKQQTFGKSKQELRRQSPPLSIFTIWKLMHWNHI